MVRVRDEHGNWTKEASEYTCRIKDIIKGMLKLGEDMGFNNEDIFYLIVTEVNTQQLLNLLSSTPCEDLQKIKK